jgi:hypothetical protein
VFAGAIAGGVVAGVLVIFLLALTISLIVLALHWHGRGGKGSQEHGKGTQEGGGDEKIEYIMTDPILKITNNNLHSEP